MTEILTIIRSDDIRAYLDFVNDKRITSNGLIAHLNIADMYLARKIWSYVFSLRLKESLPKSVAHVHAHDEHCICDKCFFAPDGETYIVHAKDCICDKCFF